MATELAAAARTGALNAVVDLLDAATATIEIRTGAAADPDAAAIGTLLATLTCSVPAFGAASDDGTTATATASAITDDSSADDTGTAAHFRALDSASACVLTGTVTATGGGGDMTLNSVSITSGGVVSLTAWTVTLGQTQS